MKKIYITGMSGTGKTTLAKELSKRGIHAISIDEVDGLCVWKNKKSGEVVEYEAKLNEEFINTHDWICDIEYLKRLIEKGKDTVVVFGDASNREEYLNLFDKILLLQCKPETFIKRVEQRKNNVFGKEPSAQRVILGWYKKFESDLLEKGAIPIDVEPPIETVVNNLIEVIQRYAKFNL